MRQVTVLLLIYSLISCGTKFRIGFAGNRIMCGGDFIDNFLIIVFIFEIFLVVFVIVFVLIGCYSIF